MRKQVTTMGMGINFEHTDQLRTKLMNEIAEYERQQSTLKNNGTYVNFTMIQTYKELIAARREMIKRLPIAF